MTRDDIIRMAVECQLVTTANRDGIYMEALERFANLVAAAERAKFLGPVGWMDPMELKIRRNTLCEVIIKPRTCAPELEVYLRAPESNQ
jgi:hypothetical protein